jgi:YesN/AraC family two-component response regulator
MKMIVIKILVADDEATVRAFIQAVISKEQLPVASVTQADNGITAIRLAHEFRPDLIFLDIRMPGLDGLQAAELILVDDPKANIVIISAYNEFDYARTAFRAGVADYLLKPIKPTDLANIIKKTAEKCEQTDKSDFKQPVKSQALVEKVENYVVINLNKPIQLRDIARAVFVSPYHLSRTFKHLTGQSIMGYVQEQRLIKASELLATTDLSINEIVDIVGFNDAAYFTTCFKNKIGIPPMKYRKAQEIKNK